MRAIFSLVIAVQLVGCQGGNSLTRDNLANEYDVTPTPEGGYLVRYNGWGSEEGKIAKWHKKAAELCGEGNYEGTPRIFSYSHTGNQTPAMAYGGGLLGVAIAASTSGSGGQQVASGSLKCNEQPNK